MFPKKPSLGSPPKPVSHLTNCSATRGMLIPWYFPRFHKTWYIQMALIISTPSSRETLRLSEEPDWMSTDLFASCLLTNLQLLQWFYNLHVEQCSPSSSYRYSSPRDLTQKLRKEMQSASCKRDHPDVQHDSRAGSCTPAVAEEQMWCSNMRMLAWSSLFHLLAICNPPSKQCYWWLK